MENFDLLALLDSLEDDLKKFSKIDMENLESYANKDVKLEEGLIHFMISTLPGDMKILNIDFKQESWGDFQNSLNKITLKLKLVGIEELVELSKKLDSLCQPTLNRRVLTHTFAIFNAKTEELIVSLKNLYKPA